jgi:putative restriction endonuclease
MDLVFHDHGRCRSGGNMREYNRDQMSVVYETETPPAPRADLGPYRRADYLALPDEPRCELLYGRLVLMTAPTVRHQLVVVEVLRLLYDFAARVGGRALVSPVDVDLADHSIVQPDVIYVAPAQSSILTTRVEGALLSRSRSCRPAPLDATSVKSCGSTARLVSSSTGSSIPRSEPSSSSSAMQTVFGFDCPWPASTGPPSLRASRSTSTRSGEQSRAERPYPPAPRYGLTS